MDLRTERLWIHPVRPRDRDAVARIWSSPRVTRHLHGPRCRKGMRRALREHADPGAPLDLWVVEERDTGRVVGHCGLLPRRVGDADEVELVYVLGSRHWGRGYATEVGLALLDHARTLGLVRVVALVDPENLASLRVAARLGMVHERTVARPEGRLMVLAVELDG